jgi:riboflavin synthase
MKMFTGLVKSLSSIQERTQNRLFVRLPSEWENQIFDLGESIAVNGVCLTIAETVQTQLIFDVSAETLSRSNLGDLKPDETVHLERALTLSERLGGHLVQGHVDGKAVLVQIKDHPTGKEMEIEIPETLKKYCIEKGSITVDGVSLTINQVANNRIHLFLIPHTLERTRFAHLSSGAYLNIEVDLIAKYVEKLCSPYLK